MSSEINGSLIGISRGGATECFGTFSLMNRVYYSSYHLWAAKHFTQLALDIENRPGTKPRFDIQHRAYVTNAILSSVAFLEAAINELLKDVIDGHESYIEPIDENSRIRLKVMWELTEEKNNYSSVLSKYQSTLQYCQKEKFNPGIR